jgi:hypothetical protein
VLPEGLPRVDCWGMLRTQHCQALCGLGWLTTEFLIKSVVCCTQRFCLLSQTFPFILRQFARSSSSVCREHDSTEHAKQHLKVLYSLPPRVRNLLALH